MSDTRSMQVDDNMDGRPNLAKKLRLNDDGVHARKLEMQAAMRELQVMGLPLFLLDCLHDQLLCIDSHADCTWCGLLIHRA